MIRRALLLTINADHPQTGMLRAFREVLGDANVAEYDYLAERRRGVGADEVNRRFVALAKGFSPDWVWLQLQETGVISPGAISEVRRALPGCVVSHWMGDCRVSVGPYLRGICAATDLTLVSNVGQLPMYRAAGAREARYLQIGLDWDEDVLGLPPWEPRFRVPDVVFCGGHYGGAFPGTADRVAALRALLDAGIDAGVVSQTQWPRDIPVVGSCHVKQQHHVWKRAAVALNVNHFNDIELYYSDRQIIAMASGTPLVCVYVPGLEREFANGRHCFWYRSPGELVGRVRALLADPGARREIGARGRSLVLARHTWEYRVRSVLPSVEELAGRRQGVPA